MLRKIVEIHELDCGLVVVAVVVALSATACSAVGSTISNAASILYSIAHYMYLLYSCIQMCSVPQSCLRVIVSVIL